MYCQGALRIIPADFAFNTKLKSWYRNFSELLKLISQLYSKLTTETAELILLPLSSKRVDKSKHQNWMRKTFQDFASELSKKTCCYRNYLHGFNVTQESKSTSGNQRHKNPPSIWLSRWREWRMAALWRATLHQLHSTSSVPFLLCLGDRRMI